MIENNPQHQHRERVDMLLDSYIQAAWYKSPAEYRAYAEKYFVKMKPLEIKAGLAEG